MSNRNGVKDTSAAAPMPVFWRPGRAVAISPDGAEVWHFGGAGPLRLGGRHAGPLAAAVDGTRTLEAVIAHAAAAGMAPEDAAHTARRWHDAGHLVSTRPDVGCVAVRLIDRTREAPTITGQHFGPLVSRLADVLALAGINVGSQTGAHDLGTGPCLTAVVVDDLLESACQVASLQVADPPVTDHHAPLVTVQIRGERPLVSPLLQSGASCPVCLDSRLRLRRTADLVAAARVGLAVPPPSPLLHDMAVPLVAGVLAAVARACSHAENLYRHCLTVLYPAIGRIEHHALIPVASCPACDPDGPSVVAAHLTDPLRLGAAGNVASAEMNSVVQNLQSEGGGGFRIIDPAETWERYAPLISDVVGIVPAVSATGPREFRAFSAGANIAASEDLVMLRSRLRASASGKGLTLTAARTGALAEALERDTLRARGGEPHRRARMAELDGAIHPNDIQLFSSRQLQQAEQLWALGLQDPEGSGMHRVPRRFDTAAEHDWSPVTDLRTGRLHWLPASLVWFNWPSRPPGYPSGSSNGAAAGNTLQEALLQGLLERVERDAVALWWYPRCRRPAIDLTAWNDPRIEAALAPQRAMGTEVWVLDLTTDLGIPAAVAIGVGMKSAPRVPLLGFGAHLDPLIAVVRALTELAQMQAPLSMLDPSAPLEFPGVAERIWFSEVTPENEPWLKPQGMVAPAASQVYKNIGDALDDAVGRVAARGMNLLWADCTRPDIGLSVVRTWVPGLRHFWNRFAPGRLYEVPPAIGWCEQGYGEDDLNPRAMIL